MRLTPNGGGQCNAVKHKNGGCFGAWMPAAPNGAGGGQGCGAYGRSIARVGGKVSGWGQRGGGFAPHCGRLQEQQSHPKADVQIAGRYPLERRYWPSLDPCLSAVPTHVLYPLRRAVSLASLDLSAAISSVRRFASGVFGEGLVTPRRWIMNSIAERVAAKRRCNTGS